MSGWIQVTMQQNTIANQLMTSKILSVLSTPLTPLACTPKDVSAMIWTRVQNPSVHMGGFLKGIWLKTPSVQSSSCNNFGWSSRPKHLGFFFCGCLSTSLLERTYKAELDYRFELDIELSTQWTRLDDHFQKFFVVKDIWFFAYHWTLKH